MKPTFTMPPWGAARPWYAVAVALLGAALIAAAPLSAQRLSSSARDAQAAVLFDHVPGTIHDVPARILLDVPPSGVLPSDVRLNSVAMRRQPYHLSDGLQLRQTPDCEEEAYVRQVIEHPLSNRTVVVFPGEASGATARAARLLAMIDLALLNPDRLLLAARDDDAITLFGDSPAVRGQPLSPDAADILRLLVSGASATDAFADLMGLTLSGMGNAAQAVGPTDQARAELTRATIEALLGRGDPVLEALIDGQGLLVVTLVEREIRRAARATELTNEQMDLLNGLQNRLAGILGRASTPRLVFEPEYPPARETMAILRQIDAVLFTATGRIVADGLVTIRQLFLEQVPDTFAGAQTSELVSVVEQTGPRALLFVETGNEGLYDLIRASMETSAFNLVIMGGAAPAAAPHPAPGQSTGLLRTAVVDSALNSDPAWAELPQKDLKLAVEELRISAAGARLGPDGAVVTLDVADDDVMYVGIAFRDGARSFQARLLVLRAASPREAGEAVDALAASGAIEPLERRVLAAWALLAQAAADL